MSIQQIAPMEGWLQRAADVVNGGGVVALAYERLFGLAADALNPDAVARSAAIKDRPTKKMGIKPISVILPSLEHVSLVSPGLPEQAKLLAKRIWPGPLTLLVPAKEGLPLPLIGPGGLIGLRIPGPSAALDLVRYTQKVLTATSANRKDEAEPTKSADLLELDGVDLVIQGEVNGPPGSTIAVANGSELTILRQGILSLAELGM